MIFIIGLPILVTVLHQTEKRYITRILKNRSLEGSLLNNIANVYTSLGELKKAEKIYKESLTIGQEIADYTLEATVLNNLSLIYSRLRNESYMLSYQPEYTDDNAYLLHEKYNKKGFVIDVLLVPVNPFGEMGLTELEELIAFIRFYRVRSPLVFEVCVSAA